jgi:L-aspartate oxidase
VQRAATAGPGVIRTAAGLAEAAQALADLASGRHAVHTRSKREKASAAGTAGTTEWETTNLHAVASALANVAALRTETRGGHYREDHPDSDPRWAGRLVTRLDETGCLRTRFVPLA